MTSATAAAYHVSHIPPKPCSSPLTLAAVDELIEALAEPFHVARQSGTLFTQDLKPLQLLALGLKASVAAAASLLRRAHCRLPSSRRLWQVRRAGRHGWAVVVVASNVEWEQVLIVIFLFQRVFAHHPRV